MTIKTITGENVAVDEEILDPKQAAAFCDISRATLYNKVNQYCFPPKHKISGVKVGFLKSDLQIWKDLGELTFKLRFGEKLKLTAATLAA